MEKIDKGEESGDHSSSFSDLPDEIVLEILRRVIDLKSLCLCKLVSIRFNLIIPQVNAISFTCTRVDHPTFDSKLHCSNSNSLGRCFICECKPFVNVIMKPLKTFSGLKSLCIEIPPPPKVADNHFPFKWNIKLGNSVDSFLFLSPNSICDMKENVQDDEEEEEDEVKSSKKEDIACDCLWDAFSRYGLLLRWIKCFPLLENATITDAGKWGRISLCGEKIVEGRSSPDPYSDPETIKQMTESLFNNMRKRSCYVPLLKLPVTGYVMKGVYLEKRDFVNDDSSMNMNLNDFEDKEEAAYSEAVMEIFKKNIDWK